MINALTLLILFSGTVYLVINSLLNKHINNEIYKNIYRLASRSIKDKRTNEEYNNNPDKYTESLLEENKEQYISDYMKKESIFYLSFFYSSLLSFKINILLYVKFLREQLPNISSILIISSLLIWRIVKSNDIKNPILHFSFLNDFIVLIFFSVFFYFISVCWDYINNETYIDEIIKNDTKNKYEYSELFYKIYKNELHSFTPILAGLSIIFFIFMLFLVIFTFNDFYLLLEEKIGK